NSFFIKGEIIFFQNNFISLRLIIIGFFFVGIGLILKIYFRAEVTWSAICMYGSLLYCWIKIPPFFIIFILRHFILIFFRIFLITVFIQFLKPLFVSFFNQRIISPHYSDLIRTAALEDERSEERRVGKESKYRCDHSD